MYSNCFIQKQPPELFHKKEVLASFVKFTGKHLHQNLFYDKVAGLRHKQISSKEQISSVDIDRFVGILKLFDTKVATGGVLLIKVFLQISRNSHENTCARVSLLTKFLS